MSSICVDCGQEHAAPKTDKGWILCVDALRANLEQAKLQLSEEKAKFKTFYDATVKAQTEVFVKLDAEKLAHSKSVCTAMKTMEDLAAANRLKSEVEIHLRDLIDTIDPDHHMGRGLERLENHDACEICAIIERGKSQKPKCVCGGVGLGVSCEPGCPNCALKRKDEVYKRNCPNCGAVGYCECK